MVDLAPFVFAPNQRAGVEAMVAAIEAGNQESRRQFIANNLFLPTSDRKLVEDVLAVMLATPCHVATSAMRRDLAFDGPAVAAQCMVPALHLAATPPHECYVCPNGQCLKLEARRHKIGNHLYRRSAADATDCEACPLREKCLQTENRPAKERGTGRLLSF
ncbi:MAG TPA: transposase [Candidatus Tectomicrobia bacterium]